MGIPAGQKITYIRRMKLSTALLLAFLLTTRAFTQTPGSPETQTVSYTPSPQNEKAREWFADAKFGLFIHWGPFSIPGDGEWVMNNRNITVKNYTRLEKFFNPIVFDGP